jgi:uncharacterized protein (UPF0261 family)
MKAPYGVVVNPNRISMNHTKTILIIATLDTKKAEAVFLKRRIEEKGFNTLVMDTGIMDASPPFADIPSEKIARTASASLADLVALRDESKAMALMAKGAETVAAELFEGRFVDGVIALGGTMGTSLALQVFRRLPVGVTKVMVSTIAISYFVRPPDISNDVIMVQTAADLWGLNRLSKRDLTKGAAVVCAATLADGDVEKSTRPLVMMSTLGGSWLTYAFVLKASLEVEGYEVAISHSVSMQGALMERLIEDGKVAGLLDLCPQEVLTELCGGYCASPGRMEAASKIGIPQIVGPGGLGVFPCGSLKDLPERFNGRVVKAHNEIASAVKATIAEMQAVGRIMADKVNRSRGPVVVVIPEKGFHVYDGTGEFFDYPEGRQVFLESLETHLRSGIALIKMRCHINDPEYARRVSEIALKLFSTPSRPSGPDFVGGNL